MPGVPVEPEGWESRFTSGGAWTVRSQLFRFARRMWAAGVTPGMGIRMLGPWGPSIVEGYVKRRFSVHGQGFAPEEADIFKARCFKGGFFGGAAWSAGAASGGARRALSQCPRGPSADTPLTNPPPHQAPSQNNPQQDYFYHIASAPGSGEHALRHLLAPGAWAHSPLEARLKELKARCPTPPPRCSSPPPRCALLRAQ